MTAWSLAELLAGHADPPAIRLVPGTKTDRDIGALHHRGDCFVSLCRSEGWGLGAFDAAAYGNPVVTTGFGGHSDYLAGTPYLVDFDLVPVHDPSGFRAMPPTSDGPSQTSTTVRPYSDVSCPPRRRPRQRPRPLTPGRSVALPVGGHRHRHASGRRRAPRRRSPRRCVWTPSRLPLTIGIRWLSVGPGSGYGDASEAYLSGLRAAAASRSAGRRWGGVDTAGARPFGPLR